MEYDWMRARLAEMFPDMHRDAAVERELFDCVLVEAKRDFARAVQLVVDMQEPGKKRPVQVAPPPPPPPAKPQCDVSCFLLAFHRKHSDSVPPAVVLHVPPYWRKYWWSRAQHMYDVKIQDAEAVLFDRDITFMRMTEEQGFAALDRRMAIFPRKELVKPGMRKKGKKGKWVPDANLNNASATVQRLNYGNYW
jgi:hypothetical protein